MVGMIHNEATVENCASSVSIHTVSGTRYAGGVAGNNSNSTVGNCYMNLRLLDNIQDTCNIWIWLNGLVSQEYLLGARVELKASENPVTSLLAGIISFHIYLTLPVPAQEIHFTLEFDVDYLTSALKLAA